MGKREWKTVQTKIPGQSWTLKEKLDVVNAICADRQFSHGEARAAVTMILYFHNTTSGDLYPSRKQVAERCGITKEITINATRKMKRLGYIYYEQTSGGRNERNTYHLRKLCSERVGISDPIGNETVKKTDSGGRENRLAGVGKTDPQISLEVTTGMENDSALPLPHKGEASASPEKEEASSGERIVTLLTSPPNRASPEGQRRPPQEVINDQLEGWEKIKRQMGR